MSKEIETKGLYSYDEKDYERGNFEVELIISDQYCDVCRGEVVAKFVKELSEGVGLEGSTIKLTPRAVEAYVVVRQLE